MSGDAKKKQRGFSKAKGAAPAAGATSADAKKNGTLRGGGEPVRGAGICTKCVFFLLLVTFSVLITVNMVDYKAGQLKEAYLKHIPEEVRHILAMLPVWLACSCRDKVLWKLCFESLSYTCLYSP